MLMSRYEAGNDPYLISGTEVLKDLDTPPPPTQAALTAAKAYGARVVQAD